MSISNSLIFCTLTFAAASAASFGTAGAAGVAGVAGIPARQSVAAEPSDSLQLSLEDLFPMIESRSSAMHVLRSAEEAAGEGLADAKNARLPDISAEADVSYIGDAFLTGRDFSGFTRAGTPHFGNGFTLEAMQVVYAGGAVKAGVDMAGAQALMASARTDSGRLDLRLLAVGQYLDLYKIANDIRIYGENIALTQKLIDEINVRREQGLALADDVTRYELRLEMLKLQLVSLQNTGKVLNYRLCNTLGLPEGTVIAPSLGEVEDLRGSGDGAWQQTAAQSSPALRISGLDADIADVRCRLAKSDLLPKISVVAHESFNGPITFEVPPIDKNLNIWYVGLGVRYNLGALYKSSRKVRQADVQARQARQALRLTEENLRNDVYQAYVGYCQSYVELRTKEKSLQLASENYERVLDRYMEQLALVTDMLDAFNMKLDAEIGVADMRAEILYRQCKLKYAAGVL